MSSSIVRQARDGGLNERTVAHLGELADDVSELADLERRAQLSFIGTDFATGAVGGGIAQGSPPVPMQVVEPDEAAAMHPKPAAKRDAAGRARGGRRR